MKNLIGEAVCRICQESFSTTVNGMFWFLADIYYIFPQVGKIWEPYPIHLIFAKKENAMPHLLNTLFLISSIIIEPFGKRSLGEGIIGNIPLLSLPA